MSTRTLSTAAIGLVTALFVAISAAPVRAQPADAEEKCTPDVMRLCNDFIPDRDKIVVCLKKKRRALSPECRGALSGGGGKARHRRHRKAA